MRGTIAEKVKPSLMNEHFEDFLTLQEQRRKYFNKLLMIIGPMTAYRCDIYADMPHFGRCIN